MKAAIGAPVMALLCSVQLGCDEQRGKKSITPVRVHVVEPTNTVDTSKYSATIIPGRRVDLAFKVGGYIEELT